jgi:hypothetical protein
MTSLSEKCSFFKYPNLRFDQCPKFSFGVTVDGVFFYCILTRALQGKTAADKLEEVKDKVANEVDKGYKFYWCPASPEKEDQRAAGSPAASTQLALCLRLAMI